MVGNEEEENDNTNKHDEGFPSKKFDNDDEEGSATKEKILRKHKGKKWKNNRKRSHTEGKQWSNFHVLLLSL